MKDKILEIICNTVCGEGQDGSGMGLENVDKAADEIAQLMADKMFEFMRDDVDDGIIDEAIKQALIKRYDFTEEQVQNALNKLK